MKIFTKQKDNVVTLEVEGRLETGTAPDLDVALFKILSESKSVVLDFKKLEYVSSAGLRVLLSAQKSANAHNSTLKIINANDVVKEVFNLTGFNTILTVS